MDRRAMFELVRQHHLLDHTDHPQTDLFHSSAMSRSSNPIIRVAQASSPASWGGVPADWPRSNSGQSTRRTRRRGRLRYASHILGGEGQGEEAVSFPSSFRCSLLKKLVT